MKAERIASYYQASDRLSELLEQIGSNQPTAEQAAEIERLHGVTSEYQRDYRHEQERLSQPASQSIGRGLSGEAGRDMAGNFLNRGADDGVRSFKLDGGGRISSLADGETLSDRITDHRVSRADLTDAIIGAINPAMQSDASRLSCSHTGTVIQKGGAFLRGGHAARMIDLTYSQATVTRAGARRVPMEAGISSLTVTRQTSGHTAHWRGPGESVEPSDSRYEQVQIVPHSLACCTVFENELASDAASFVPTVMMDITKAMAVTLDRGCLRGTGTGASIRGLRNTPNVPIFDGEQSLVGERFENPHAALRLIMNNDYQDDASNLSLIMSPDRAVRYDEMRNGNLDPVQWPPLIGKMKRFHSTSVPSNLAALPAADPDDLTSFNSAPYSEEYYGDFREMAIFVRQDIEIEVLREGIVVNTLTGKQHNLTMEFKTAIRASLRADVLIERPYFFAIAQNVRLNNG